MPRILGIDPGSRYTGYGIIESDGRYSRHLVSGRIRTLEKDFCGRLGEINQGIDAIIREFSPEEVAVEQVFMAKSAGSALKLGQARGAAIVACVAKDMPVSEYSARQIKQSVVGTGAADKEQVQHMVKVLLKLPATPQEDAADALAAALCHAHTQQSMINMAGASAVRRRRIR